jgi:hypothetical protein
MGWETANMHFGSPRTISNVKRDLARRRGSWLHKAAKAMVRFSVDDWADWRKGWKTAMAKRPARKIRPAIR